MDSFYDGPRQPPAPTALNKINKTPTVPEISVIESNLPQLGNFPHILTKNASNLNDSWTNFTNSSAYRKPDTFFDPTSQKHVRFQSPDPSFNQQKENIPVTSSNFQNLHGKTFKQIYMANVPNRHLDLSILEPINSSKPNITNLESKEQKIAFSNTVQNVGKNDYKPAFSESRLAEAKSRFNYPQDDSFLQFPRKTDFTKPHFYDKNCNKPTITSNTLIRCPTINKIHKSVEPEPNNAVSLCDPKTLEQKPSTSDDEPTLKDLFKIIQAQNEQIMRLQEQVSSIKTSIKPQIEAPTQEAPFARPFYNNINHKSQKFSIDLKATSFEVSFRPQFNNRNTYGAEAKIEEIVEVPAEKGFNSCLTDLKLDEPVNDSYMSAVPSIEINMEDYKEDSSEDEEESDEASLNIGATFYKDLMNQVNNALRSMKIQQSNLFSNQSNELLKGQTMKAVKQATLQHLKSIGVNLPPIKESSEISHPNESGNSDEHSEISVAVKQLLMKYLPDDKLAEAIRNGEKPNLKTKMDGQKKFGQEFSFATMQYLKKYNILDTTTRKNKGMPGPNNNVPKGENPKILDVTALKLQPKLL